jgi:tetratricopeptide (TPR) repeat protein
VPVIASLFSYDTTFCVVVQWSFVPYPDSGTRIQPGHSPARGAQPLSPGACPAAVSRASSRTPRRAASHSSRPAQGLYACAAQHALQDQRPLGYARRGGRYQRYEHDQRCGKLAGLERTEEGIAQIQRGLEIVRDIDSKAYLTSFLAGLAEAYTDAGQVEAAVAALEEAFDLVDQISEIGERFCEAELHRLKGRLWAL